MPFLPNTVSQHLQGYVALSDLGTTVFGTVFSNAYVFEVVSVSFVETVELSSALGVDVVVGKVFASLLVSDIFVSNF